MMMAMSGCLISHCCPRIQPDNHDSHFRDKKNDKKFRSILEQLAVVLAGFTSLTIQAQTIPAGIASRIEIHSLASTTLNTDEFLLGNAQGKPVLLGGELRLPVGTTAKFPAVILVHGSGGIGGAMAMSRYKKNMATLATQSKPSGTASRTI